VFSFLGEKNNTNTNMTNQGFPKPEQKWGWEEQSKREGEGKEATAPLLFRQNRQILETTMTPWFNGSGGKKRRGGTREGGPRIRGTGWGEKA